MPYGKKFLDTVDGIFYTNDTNDASKKVMARCIKCEGKMSGSDDLFNMKLAGTCRACQDAELLKLKEDSTFYIPDFFARPDGGGDDDASNPGPPDDSYNNSKNSKNRKGNNSIYK